MQLQYIAGATLRETCDSVNHGGAVGAGKPREVTTRSAIELNGQR